MTATNGRLGQFEQIINFSTPSTNPRKSLYAQDVQWATNTKSLRDQFGVAASDAIADYYSTLTSSYETMVSSALTATVAAETAAFSAAKAYSIASLNADGDYSLALFDAEKTKALAYLAAEVAQVKADYAKEAELTGSRADAYATRTTAAKNLFASVQFAQGRGAAILILRAEDASVQTAYFGEIATVSSQIVAAKNAAGL